MQQYLHQSCINNLCMHHPHRNNMKTMLNAIFRQYICDPKQCQINAKLFNTSILLHSPYIFKPPWYKKKTIVYIKLFISRGAAEHYLYDDWKRSIIKKKAKPRSNQIQTNQSKLDDARHIDSWHTSLGALGINPATKILKCQTKIKTILQQNRKKNWKSKNHWNP